MLAFVLLGLLIQNSMIVKSQQGNEANLLQRIQQLENTIQQLMTYQQMSQDKTNAENQQDSSQDTTSQTNAQQSDSKQQSTPAKTTEADTSLEIEKSQDTQNTANFEFGVKGLSSQYATYDQSAQLMSTMKIMQASSKQDSNLEQIMQVIDSATPSQVQKFIHVMKMQTPEDVNQQLTQLLTVGDIQTTRNQILNIMNGEIQENIFETDGKDQTTDDQNVEEDDGSFETATTQDENLKSENTDSVKLSKIQEEQEKQDQETGTVQDSESVELGSTQYEDKESNKDLEVQQDQEQQDQQTQTTEDMEKKIDDSVDDDNTMKSDEEELEFAVDEEQLEDQLVNRFEDLGISEQTPTEQEEKVLKDEKEAHAQTYPLNQTDATPSQECSMDEQTCEQPINPEMDELEPQLEKVHRYINTIKDAPVSEQELDLTNEEEEKASQQSNSQSPTFQQFQQLPKERTNVGGLQLPSKAAPTSKLHFLLTIFIIIVVLIANM